MTPPSGMDEGEQNIHHKLNDKFDPTELAVQDVSGAFTYGSELDCTLT